MVQGPSWQVWTLLSQKLIGFVLQQNPGTNEGQAANILSITSRRNLRSVLT